MPGWNDLGTAFATLRELDVTAIKAESERPVVIACFGPRALASRVGELMYALGARHYGPAGRNPFIYQPKVSQAGDETSTADMLLVLIDATRPLSRSESADLAQLGALMRPTVIALCGVADPGDLGAPRPEFAQAKIVVLPHLDANGGTTLADAILEQLPEERRLAAARAVPGLRTAYARELINSVSLTNGTYALASAIPQQLPIISIPFAAADLIVLTKNQALMVYRLALAHGAPPEFQARLVELAPVIGGAFLWRQLARTLISLIPVWGVVPKVAIAYAGTYSTGIAATQWFAKGELIEGQRLKQLGDEALKLGRERATALVAEARTRTMEAGVRMGQRKARKP
ncbi:MAG: hypothetical protein AB4911_13970 [Oscillochloridaceae bacterium umkhey_bin13]